MPKFAVRVMADTRVVQIVVVEAEVKADAKALALVKAGGPGTQWRPAHEIVTDLFVMDLDRDVQPVSGPGRPRVQLPKGDTPGRPPRTPLTEEQRRAHRRAYQRAYCAKRRAAYPKATPAPYQQVSEWSPVPIQILEAQDA